MTSGSRGVSSARHSGRRDPTFTVLSEAPPVYGAVAEKGELGLSEDDLRAREEEEELEAAVATRDGETRGGAKSAAAVEDGATAAVVSAPEAAAAAVLASADRDASRWPDAGVPGDRSSAEGRALTRREQEGLKRHALAAAALTSANTGVKEGGLSVRVREAFFALLWAFHAARATHHILFSTAFAEPAAANQTNIADIYFPLPPPPPPTSSPLSAASPPNATAPLVSHAGPPTRRPD